MIGDAIFFILLGTVFVAQYFLGYNLDGTHTGFIPFLFIAIVFIGRGIIVLWKKNGTNTNVIAAALLILIGSIFVAQYFLGYDPQSDLIDIYSFRLISTPAFLLIAIVFIGYGIFGFLQNRKARKNKVGNVSTKSIRDAIDKEKAEIKTNNDVVSEE